MDIDLMTMLKFFGIKLLVSRDKQIPNDEEEYYQIHVDVLYIPTEENKDFQRTIWNEDIEEDIFSYIKKTPEFNFCKDKVFSKIEIYLDET